MRDNPQKKTITLLTLFILSISILLCIFIAFHQVSTKKITLSDNLFQESNIVTYNIDYVGRDNMVMSGIGAVQNGAGLKYYLIQGYAGIETESIKTFNSQILLKKDDSTKYYYCLSTEMAIRDDLAEFGDNKVSFSHGGFVARIKADAIPPGKYNIYIHYQNDEHNILVKTDSILEVEDEN